MEESDIRRLEALRAAIKREWEALLRSEPTLSPLGNPDTLVYMMDETLDRVCADLHEHCGKRGHRSQQTPLQRRCSCGLNPLLNYYSTGELAVRAAAGPLLGAAIECAVTSFHFLAQKEIDTLCSVCCYRHREDYAVTALSSSGR